MKNTLSLINYRIDNIMADFQAIEKTNKYVLCIQIRFGLNEERDKGIIEISPTIKEDINGTTIYAITNTNYYDLPQLSSEEECIALLKESGAEEAYNRTKDIMNEILKISNVDFIELPQFNASMLEK